MCVCLFVCVYPFFFEKKIVAGGPQGPLVIFSDYKMHTINIIIPNQIEKLLGSQNTQWKQPYFCEVVLLIRNSLLRFKLNSFILSFYYYFSFFFPEPFFTIKYRYIIIFGKEKVSRSKKEKVIICTRIYNNTVKSSDEALL